MHLPRRKRVRLAMRIALALLWAMLTLSSGDVEQLDGVGFDEPIAEEFPLPAATQPAGMGVKGIGVNLQVSSMDTAALAMYQEDTTALVRKLAKTRPMILTAYGG